MVCSIQYRIRLAWRLRCYLFAVAFASELTGLEPNMDKVGYWIKKGIRLGLVRS